MFLRLSIVCVCAVAVCSLATAHEPKLPEGVTNSQRPGDKPLPPKEAIKKIRVPKGFNITLFAGEPNVMQPIAMAFDDRGRLWVVECYSYPGWQNPDARDRVIILDDTDRDGRFDSRKVFWDRGRNLTGIELGFGGVWLLSTPELIFIPDANRDDVPDGKPEVILDGWNDNRVGHNVVNGLQWGPDGWLWGRHGIQGESIVGPPGAPAEKRTKLNCAIWRWHPTKRIFEVVAHGTTNPWGMDFDDYGQAFFTNNVIGHLWHVVPGARYKRMHGTHYNPHLYELMDQTADHFHWAGKKWQASRLGEDHDALGGGHSHCGGTIYLGDNWPTEYRGTILMGNIHGNRLNRDRLVRAGSTYRGEHLPDFLKADDPWFRSIWQHYGPDGGLFLADWNDLGECHDHDGVYRGSGRIYKVTYGEPKKLAPFDLTRKTDAELAALQLHSNDWYVRHARRLLQERAARGELDETTPKLLKKILAENADVTRQLRALWTLHVTGTLDDELLAKQLSHGSEHVRWWAIQLLSEPKKLSEEDRARFVTMARNDKSLFVQLALASTLSRLNADDAWPIAEALASRATDGRDRWLSLLLWYGVEPLVANDTDRGARLMRSCPDPLVRRFVARRLAHSDEGLVAATSTLTSKSKLPTGGEREILDGVLDALRGRRNVTMPKTWPAAFNRLSKHTDSRIRESADAIALAVGDPQIATRLRVQLNDKTAPVTARRRALTLLLDKNFVGLASDLQSLLANKSLRLAAIRGLASYDDEKTPKLLLRRYKQLSREEKSAVVATLSSRRSYAKELLRAMEDDRVVPTDVSAFAARQITNFGDEQLTSDLARLWGRVAKSSADRRKEIDRYKKILNQRFLKNANLSAGRLVYKNTCQQCHKLYGEGGVIGPDLTGSNRDNLDYILENVIDPSAVVARDYQMQVIATDSGRVVSGVVAAENDKTLTIQTATDKVILDKSDIAERRMSENSLMPEGNFSKLSREQVRDLVGYLRSKSQVDLPKSDGGR
ncbi:MAG: c-type cytochrome [Pirellulales bacterium]|nr:c-type cytochrome [Pirellulales bacterium]